MSDIPIQPQERSPLAQQVINDVQRGSVGTMPLFGWGAFRSSSTIVRGGWGGPGTGKTDWLHPSQYTRFRNQSPFIETHSSLTSKILANRFYNNEKAEAGVIGRQINKGGRLGARADRAGMLDAQGNITSVYNPNLFGRAIAAGRIGRMSELSPSTLEASRSYLLQSADPNVAMRMGLGDAETFASRATPRSLQAAHFLSPEGNVSQRFMGYASSGIRDFPEELISPNRAVFASARRVAMRDREIVSGGMRNVWRTAGERATLRATEHAVGDVAVKEGESLALKTAGKIATSRAAASILGRAGAAAAANAVPVVGQVVSAAMTAWMIFDIAKLGAALGRDLIFNPIANGVKEGFKSFTGQISKAPFGMGYVDNEVAATSRARGVMAIQNSRLNARSLLGSEGSMLHAHFG